jgi:hypothetical protein
VVDKRRSFDLAGDRIPAVQLVTHHYIKLAIPAPALLREIVLSIICLYIIYNTIQYNNQVEEDEMGGPCSTTGGEEERL